MEENKPNKIQKARDPIKGGKQRTLKPKAKDTMMGKRKEMKKGCPKPRTLDWR